MKKILKFVFLSLLITLPFVWSGCGGPGHVTIGVGVAVPGPWMGPYPGGGVWVGRPFPGHYYPLKDDYRQFVLKSKDKKAVEKPGKKLAVADTVPRRHAGE